MNLKDLQNKKIGILGWGIENQALVDFLIKKKVRCEITICDARENISVEAHNYASLQINYQLGKNFNKNLYKFDILFRSPGWPIFCPGIVETRHASSQNTRRGDASSLRGHKTVLSSPMKLFFDLCPTKNIIGVTGTKGKGTISSLIFKILKTAGKRAYLGGNIGVAPFAFLNKIKKNDWVVLELSSFQLEDFNVSPHIAVIINFSPEHLAPADPNNPNYHKSMKDYWNAKSRIFMFQGSKGYLVINSKIRSRVKSQVSKVIKFGKSELPSSLPGEHNKENIAAAVEVAKIVGIKKEIIARAVKKFKGLEHRIEFVRELKGVKYYDDSFATTPDSAITALKSFSAPIILLAGGAEKNSDFREFAREVKKRVKFLILLDGKATPRFKKEILKTGYSLKNIKIVKSMKEAVSLARAKSASGDIVLLSTACASFGMFKNYKQRGGLFKNEVNTLKSTNKMQIYK
ncbi:MAG: UDP-N-acetylmuramoyl-L-alanine--D-glutamate ligase [Patescibacteria group bacterium]|nr:UDP-N-acetylmuramoyl-L-alanine--D-glutamate ligase [Patescibacteria group bacterium]MDD4610650.1 UDP-N-acetylmuramoyl-L-alanine--D-glutamate ligase [Patescibacteria group bacterium]